MPSVRFRLNGVETAVDADPERSLLDILRGRLGMTGAHFGCGANECGACNVMIGDQATASCDTPLWSVADKDITTSKDWERASGRIRCKPLSSPSRPCNAATAFPEF